jgi:hypothetical protein
MKAVLILTAFFCLIAFGCKDDSTKQQSERSNAPDLTESTPTPQTLERVVALSSIDFSQRTSVSYEGDGGGRIDGYRSWVLHGSRLRDAVFAAVDRGKWSEVSPDTAKKILAAKVPVAATIRSTEAFLGEWVKNGKKFSGVLLLCETEDYLQLDLLP